MTLSASARRSLDAAARQIREVCAQHAMDATALALAISAADDPGLRRCVAFVFNAAEAVPTVPDMRRTVAAVELALDLQEPLEVKLDGRGRRALGALRAAFAATVLVLSTWLVIGGIVSGQNEFAHATSPATAIIVLLAALVLLAFLEAAHIGAVALSTADVTALRQSHPRVFRMHRHIATKPRLEEYLAARQVGVVLVVFFISEVTRTANMTTLPGTGVNIPEAFALLLQVGVPGALLVLVLGQVLPQILTARRPATMMDLPPMWAAFHLTRAIGTLGLARPASWLLEGLRMTERIPSAPRERYNLNRLDVDGFGISAVHRTLRINAAGSTSTTSSTVLFSGDDFAEFPIDLATAVHSPRRVQVKAALADDPERAVVVNEMFEARLTKPDALRLSSSLAPRVGTFDAGDLLTVVSELDFSSLLSEDVLIVSAPTKLVTMRVLIDHAPVPFPFAVLTLMRDGESFTTRRLPVRMNVDGAAELFTTIYYPPPGTVLRLSWGVLPTASSNATYISQKEAHQ